MQARIQEDETKRREDARRKEKEKEDVAPRCGFPGMKHTHTHIQLGRHDEA